MHICWSQFGPYMGSETSLRVVINLLGAREATKIEKLDTCTYALWIGRYIHGSSSIPGCKGQVTW
jgi:hypothetical protein